MTNEIDWKKVTTEKLYITNIKPNYNMQFYRDEKLVGTLDFNGPQMTFHGDMEDSAKIFFDYVAKSFAGRLEKERQEEREACAKVCDEKAEQDKLSNYYKIAAKAIRARGEKT